MRDAFYFVMLADKSICNTEACDNIAQLSVRGTICQDPCKRVAGIILTTRPMDPWHGDQERPVQRAGKVAAQGIGAFVAAGASAPAKRSAASISIVPSRREQVPFRFPDPTLHVPSRRLALGNR